MKILRIISSTNPKGGGVIESVIQSALALKKLGDSVELLCLDDPSESWLVEMAVKTYAVGPAKGSYGYCPQLLEWLQQHHSDYDHFIIDGLWQYHGLATRSVLVKNKRQYFVYTHGMLDPWFKSTYPLKHLKKWLYWLWAEYKVLKDAKKVFFTTEEEKLLARQSFCLYQCEEKVVPIGTVGVIGHSEHQKEKFISQFPYLENKQYLLFLSRIHPKKGIDLLIKAFAEKIIQYPDLQLVIAGPDQVGWQAELEQLAVSLGVADKITWTGMISGNVKWGAYHCADAFILPSHQENFGIVVAEALSCSLPVLISNKVNIWREIQADQAGFIADDTIEGTRYLLEQWTLLSTEQKTKMRQQARRCFLSHFEIEKATKSLIEALEK